MKSNNQQLLRNPDIQPTNDVIAEALGKANKAFGKFIGELANHEIQIEWRFYNDGKAWLAKGLHKWIGARGGKNEVTVFWLSIWDGFFKVTIYVPEKDRADAFRLPLADEVKRLLADSEQTGGKLKYFPVVFEVRSEEMQAAVYTLADFKISIK